MREDPVRPRKLGHAVLGTTDYATTSLFFAEGLGFKVSDRIVGVAAFLRCSTDHHNVLVLAAPVNFLHHTSWQVDDIDDVGRGRHAMLDGDPERHIWVSRHYAGSNFFWYLKDRPATSPSTTRTWTASPRTNSGPPRPGRRPQPVRLGPAAPTLVPAPRRPRRHDDRRPRTR